MVGMLGCGCCAVELCTATDFRNQIIEDYSPTFDPYFLGRWTGRLYDLEATGGDCKCAGFSVSGFGTLGWQYGVFKKSTLSEPIECFLKIVFWDDSLYQQPPNSTTPGMTAHIGIRDGGSYLDYYLNTSKYSVQAQANWYNSTGFVFRVGSFGILIPTRPKSGDVIGIRLSGFTIDASVTWQTNVIPSKAECILNGQVIYTVTNTQYFTSLKACQFDSGIFLSEPRFLSNDGVRYWPNKIRVDDFTVSAL